jgi:cyclohexyl-isocyanide hydratase
MVRDMSDLPKFRVGFLLFPDLTQLDLTGPWEVFSGMPDAECRLIWKSAGPVVAGKGMTILADTAFADCPQLDLICVPGGRGMNALLTDTQTLDFLRRQAEGASYITSVCTGSLVLGAAGLLRGKRAASHWMSRDMLKSFGAIPVAERVVVDGNVITGGGVTAGIDFALTIVAMLKGKAFAQALQLGIEYAPSPPFDAGTPETAPKEVVAETVARAKGMLAERSAEVAKAASALQAEG